MAIVSDIIRFENGEMSNREIVIFFSGLIQSGMCWKLQGCYGRMAKMLINSRLISIEGEINQQEFSDQLESYDLFDFPENDREEQQVRLLNGEE